MLPILLGLILAMLFGLMSFMVYGLEGLSHSAWIDTVFWSLIVTGIMISLINELGQCIACRIKDFIKIPRIDRFCREGSCDEFIS
ncbi:MAG: hypothetical protein P8163_18710 [Candidatus Thiodiazotropha sp.]